MLTKYLYTIIIHTQFDFIIQEKDRLLNEVHDREEKLNKEKQARDALAVKIKVSCWLVKSMFKLWSFCNK